MANENKQPTPRNIFEVINTNIVDLSKDVVTLYDMVEKIYAALYPLPIAEPTDSGTAEIKE